jgi:hypothetical protein
MVINDGMWGTSVGSITTTTTTGATSDYEWSTLNVQPSSAVYDRIGRMFEGEYDSPVKLEPDRKVSLRDVWDS